MLAKYLVITENGNKYFDDESSARNYVYKCVNWRVPSNEIGLYRQTFLSEQDFADEEWDEQEQLDLLGD